MVERQPLSPLVTTYLGGLCRHCLASISAVQSVFAASTITTLCAWWTHTSRASDILHGFRWIYVMVTVSCLSWYSSLSGLSVFTRGAASSSTVRRARLYKLQPVSIDCCRTMLYRSNLAIRGAILCCLIGGGLLRFLTSVCLLKDCFLGSCIVGILFPPRP